MQVSNSATVSIFCTGDNAGNSTLKTSVAQKTEV